MNSNSVHPIQCPICKATENSLKYTINGYKIIRCGNCRGGFAIPRPATLEVPEIYGEEYLDSYVKSPMHGMAQSMWRYEQLIGLERMSNHPLSNLPDRSVLDVGCATGNLLMCFKEAGWKTTGIDISKQLAEYAKQENNLNVLVGDLESVEIIPESFSLVTVIHVIEHFLDPPSAMQSVWNALAPGGILFVETPNWEGIGSLLRRDKWSALIPPEHLNYFGPSSINNLANQTGFKVLSMVTVTPPYLESLQYSTPIVKQLAQMAYSLSSIFKRGPTLLSLLQKGEN